MNLSSRGSKTEAYARIRYSLPKLLQVPHIQGSWQNAVEGDETQVQVLGRDLIRVIESSIMTFFVFLDMNKKNPNGFLNLCGSQNQIATPLGQIQSVVEELKELQKKRKGWKKHSWPSTDEEVGLFFGLIDIKAVSGVLRMVKITKEQLLWCEDKMKKLVFTEGKLQRDPSPILFPS